MLLLMFALAMPISADMTWSIAGVPTSDWWQGDTGSGKDIALLWAREVEEMLNGGTAGFASIYFEPGTEPDPNNEGDLYYSAVLDALVLRTASGWETLEAGGDYASLDEAYNGGAAISVDDGALTLTASNIANNVVLALVQSDTGTTKGMTITNAGTGNTIDIQGQSSSKDIEGTGNTWNVSSAGKLTCVGIDTTGTIVMANDDIISNATDDTILFTTGDEDLKLDFTTGANLLTLTSSTGMVSIDFGAIDSFVGLDDISFDVAGADNTITLAGSGAGKDLTIQQTVSAADASLILQSTGTGTDALALISSVADIDIDSADNITVDAADDITITTAGGPFTVAVTGGDVSIDSTDGSVQIDGGEAVVDAINIDSAAGGLDVDVALSISLKSTENTHDSIEIVSTAGGVDITAAGGAAEDIDIVNTAGSVNISAGENSAGAMTITVDGGSSETLGIYAIKGTGASAATESDASIQLESTVGGIGILSLLNGDNAIRLETNGGSNENIFIHSNQGTGTDSITLLSDVGGVALTGSAGGIVLTADGVSVGDITLDAEDDIILTTTGKLTIANTEAMTVSGAATIAGVLTANGTIIGDGATTLTGTIATVEAYTGAGNTISIAESGSVFTNEGDGDGVLHTLPEASTAIGCSYTFVVIENQDLIIELDNADIFMHLTCNAGDQIQSSTPNDTITVMAVSDSEWAIISVYPTAADWADGGA